MGFNTLSRVLHIAHVALVSSLAVKVVAIGVFLGVACASFAALALDLPGYAAAPELERSWLGQRPSGLMALARRDGPWRIADSVMYEFDAHSPSYRLWEGDGLGRKGVQQLRVVAGAGRFAADLIGNDAAVDATVVGDLAERRVEHAGHAERRDRLRAASERATNAVRETRDWIRVLTSRAARGPPRGPIVTHAACSDVC